MSARIPANWEMKVVSVTGVTDKQATAILDALNSAPLNFPFAVEVTDLDDWDEHHQPEEEIALALQHGMEGR